MARPTILSNWVVLVVEVSDRVSLGGGEGLFMRRMEGEEAMGSWRRGAIFTMIEGKREGERAGWAMGEGKKARETEAGWFKERGDGWL